VAREFEELAADERLAIASASVLGIEFSLWLAAHASAVDEPSLERVLEVLPADRPIVVLEPGCLSVFRDELRQLFPSDERAARLSAQATSLSEFLVKRNFKASAAGRVVMHSHCHQKALWGTQADFNLLKSCGMEVSAPDTGCCGMSGSFGYKPEHAEASRRIAQLALLPALGAAPDAVVVANGFSCREQIEALAGRPTLHIAELLARG
jgi:Fe-S oxidoreductase